MLWWIQGLVLSVKPRTNPSSAPLDGGEGVLRCVELPVNGRGRFLVEKRCSASFCKSCLKMSFRSLGQD